MKEDEEESEEEDEGEFQRRRKKKENGWTSRWGNFQRDLVAGAAMGGIVHSIVAPIERSKLLLQTQESNAAILQKKRRFRGMIDCIGRTIKEEGFLSLWRGNGTSVIRYYPSVALNFSLKGNPRDIKIDSRYVYLSVLDRTLGLPYNKGCHEVAFSESEN